MRKLKLDELRRPDVNTYKEQEKFPVVLVLDDIRSALNVGAAFRTSDALGISKIYLCGITAQPPHREITKTAIGATLSVDWEYVEDISTLLTRLQEEGYVIAALEQTTESTYLPDLEVDANRPLALIAGNEVSGVSDQALALCDMAIEIPQFGTKHSFNVSVSVGIAMWEILRKMGIV